jgi:hypothetical protein
LPVATVKVDVLAGDPSATPPATYICEFKHWQSAVSQDVIHAFRTVVADAGAHRGFVVSSNGFGSGAYEAAEHSNVDLVTWQEFQRLFVDRWSHTFMAPSLLKEGNALHEYTEPINSRIACKASALSPYRQEALGVPARASSNWDGFTRVLDSPASRSPQTLWKVRCTHSHSAPDHEVTIDEQAI